MKTSSFKRQPRALAALASTALLLTTAGLSAMPVVNTLSGGPTAGYVDGPTAQSAMFNTPVALALDPTGNLLFVADLGNNAVRQINFAANETITFATYGVNKPVGVAVDSAGNVYLLNHGNGNDGSLVEYDTFGDFLGVLASGLVNAQGLALDSVGDIYFTADYNTVYVLGSGSTIPSPFCTISTPNTFLRGITFTDHGLIAVCDYNNNGIYTIDSNAGVTALTGFNGAGDHFGTAKFAKFSGPYGITSAGNNVLVVTDYGNNRVKVVDPLGTVTNLYGVDSSFWLTGPGTYPGWADGTVCGGDINYNSFGCVEGRLPCGVVFAADGSVYTSEDYYHIIRKVTSTSLPALQPPVPAPSIGWVDYTVPPAVVVSVLQTAQPFVFNNDVTIAIEGTSGTEIHYTDGPTSSQFPDPSGTVGSTPPPYHDGEYPDQVAANGSLVLSGTNLADFTVKAIGVQPGRVSSPVVSARFQFKTANPSISGDNAALFTVTNLTFGAVMWYTIDGNDPVPNAADATQVTSSTISLNIPQGAIFKIKAFRVGYQDSDVVSKTFSSGSFVPNSISFGFSSGEASSQFVGSPGQIFYAPVTLDVIPGSKIYSLQFNVVVTNVGSSHPVFPGNYGFVSMLEKPSTNTNPVLYERIPPAMFFGTNTPPPSVMVTNLEGLPFLSMIFANTNNNLLGVGWLERISETNLYNTASQDLVKYSQAHDTLFDEANGKVVLGGYAFQIPPNANFGDSYQIQIGRPSATDDGIGAPGSAVVLVAMTNGSLTAGSENSIKIVSTAPRSYIVGDCAPFRWFNAGDFGDFILDNSDVMQVFQSAIYKLNFPPYGSDFFDSMDSCGAVGVPSNGYLVQGPPVANRNALFDGNDTTIDQIAFGDGNLDVCDVYVTFRRSLDPSRVWYQRFWTNGVRGAQAIGNQPATPQGVQPLGLQTPSMVAPQVSFSAGDFQATPGQTVQIPITAQIQGNYPLRVLMLNLTVEPLDGSPAITVPVQFSANPALGQATLGSSSGNANYAACWLNSTIPGLTSNAVLGTLTVTVPSNATAMSAYAIHFDHASASPNGLGSFPRTTTTGLVTLADRSTSYFNDGIPDSWRLRYFGSIYNLLSQASADADGDGANNWQEFVAGTDPTDAKSCLTASNDQAAATQPQDAVIHWPSVSGKTYIIERSDSIFAPVWSPVSTNTGTGSDMEIHDTTGGNVRFYRVRVSP